MKLYQVMNVLSNGQSGLGDNYKPLDTYFKNSSGEIISESTLKVKKRALIKPRLACQILKSL